MKNIFFILLIAAVTCCSCKKYLDEKSDSSLTTPSTLQDLQALLDEHMYMNQKRTGAYSECSADDYFMLDEMYNSNSTYIQGMYTWKPATVAPSGQDWIAGYTPVYTSNLCLERLAVMDKTASNEAMWNNVKGSALFFRSYYFLQLLWSHSKAYDAASSATDLGIVLRKTSDINVQSVRSDAKQGYETVLADTKECIPYLPDLPVHPMRPSKAAAYGLLARAYLSMRIYDSAYRYADLALQLKNTLMDFKGDPDINGSLNADFPFRPFNKEIIFYTTSSDLSPTFIPLEGALVDTVLQRSYSSNDLRKTAYFTPANGYFMFKGNYASNQYFEWFSGIATDEILLTRAECHARKGRKDEALTDLNALLTKRFDNSFVPVTAADADAALMIIKTERRKELLWRNMRWIDIKRYNKEGDNIVLKRRISGQEFTLQPNANFYALPLPVDLMQYGIVQNPL